METNRKEAQCLMDLTQKKTRLFWLDMLAMLVLPCVSAWYYYGGYAVKLLVVSVLSAVLCELFGCLVLKKKITIGDLSAVVTGLMIALMLPASAPVWLPICASSFAVIAAKLPFGKVERLPFSPAAAGMAFITICFPDLVFDYPKVSDALSGTGVSLAALLSQNTSVRLNSVRAIDILTGNFPGPMGAGCILVLLGSAIYMLIRRTKLFVSVAGFLTGGALVAVCLPRVTSLLPSVVLELCAGTMLFAALFLITEPGTQPEKPLYRLLFGFIGGVLCMVLRRFGAFEEGAFFAVLLTDALWPVVERLLNNAQEKRKNKKELSYRKE
ncbi:MAG TPA: hypothetical protein DDY98_04430 [Ruminococcaceae bacterium]|nr:hypothetical protein [Oscillospiraceae bacterium]